MTLLLLYGMLALGVSFVCSLMEAALLSLPRSHVEAMAAEGSRTGAMLKHLQENIDRPLSAILTLNTVAHTVGAAGVGAEAAVVFDSDAVGIASAIMTFAILVFSEIIPKTLGAVHARGLAGLTAYITRGMIWLCYPLVVLLEWVNRLLGYRRRKAGLGRGEVLATLRLGNELGSLADREHRIATNVMSLPGVRVTEIMTPRTVVFALPTEMTVADVLAEHEELNFGRIPVYEETMDHCTGYVHRFQIHKAAAEGNQELTLADLRRPVLTVPDLASVADAMEQLLNRNEHIAVLVDEYGGMSGVVTLEDLLESLLGQEITDETDPVTDMQDLARRRQFLSQTDR